VARDETYFLGFIIFFNSCFAFSAEQCSEIFATPLVEWDLSHVDSLITESQLQSFLTSDNVITRIFKFQIKSEMNPRKLLIAENYDEVVYNFYKRMRLLSILKTGDLSLKPRDWVERTILREGLRGFVKDNGSKFEELRVHQKLLSHVQKLFTRFPIVKIVATFGSLPHARDVAIPNDLMAKILVDGADAHMAEIRKIYSGKQKYVDFYRRLQWAVGVVMAIISISSIYDKLKKEKKVIEDLNNKGAFDSLDDLDNTICQMMEALM